MIPYNVNSKLSPQLFYFIEIWWSCTVNWAQLFYFMEIWWSRTVNLAQLCYFVGLWWSRTVYCTVIEPTALLYMWTEPSSSSTLWGFDNPVYSKVSPQLFFFIGPYAHWSSATLRIHSYISTGIFKVAYSIGNVRIPVVIIWSLHCTYTTVCIAKWGAHLFFYSVSKTRILISWDYFFNLLPCILYFILSLIKHL